MEKRGKLQQAMSEDDEALDEEGVPTQETLDREAESHEEAGTPDKGEEAAGGGAGGQQAATPEEQEAYEKVVTAAAAALNDQATRNSVLKMIQQQQDDPAKAVGYAATVLITQLDDKSGGKIPETIILPAAEDIVTMVAEEAQAAGMLKIDESLIGRAMQEMVKGVAEQYGVDPEELRAMIEQMDPAEVKRMVAEQEGYAAGGGGAAAPQQQQAAPAAGGAAPGGQPAGPAGGM